MPTGKYNEAIDAHRSAINLNPDNEKFYSNLLLTLHYLPEEKYPQYIDYGYAI